MCKKRCSGAVIVSITVVVRPLFAPPAVLEPISEYGSWPIKYTRKQETAPPLLDPPAWNIRRQVALRERNIPE